MLNFIFAHMPWWLWRFIIRSYVLQVQKEFDTAVDANLLAAFMAPAEARAGFRNQADICAGKLTLCDRILSRLKRKNHKEAAQLLNELLDYPEAPKGVKRMAASRGSYTPTPPQVHPPKPPSRSNSGFVVQEILLDGQRPQYLAYFEPGRKTGTNSCVLRATTTVNNMSDARIFTEQHEADTMVAVLGVLRWRVVPFCKDTPEPKSTRFRTSASMKP